MELTGKLKENVEKSENKEEAKKIIEEAGMKLTDDELDKIAGGLCGADPNNPFEVL